jgi:hypothetical protein
MLIRDIERWRAAAVDLKILFTVIVISSWCRAANIEKLKNRNRSHAWLDLFVVARPNARWENRYDTERR